MIRKYRLHHARKTSVKDNITDVITRCLTTSDPVILKHLAAELRLKRPKSNLEDLEFFDLLAEKQEPSAYMKLPNDEAMASNESESDFSDSNSDSESDIYESNSDSDSDIYESENDSDIDEPFEVEVNPNDYYFNAHSDDSDSEVEFVGRPNEE